eukprot:TCONS_00010909-protein
MIPPNRLKSSKNLQRSTNNNARECPKDYIICPNLKSLNGQLKSEIQNALQQKQFYMNSLAETNRMLAEIQSKFDTSHTENQSMNSLLFDLKKEQKETFEKLNSLEEEKEKLLSEITLSDTDAQKKILALETVETENQILSKKVTTLTDTNEKSSKKIEQLEKRIEDQSSTKESIDFEAQFPSGGISSISLVDKSVISSTQSGEEFTQTDVIVTDEKPPVISIMEIKDQKGIRPSYTRSHITKMTPSPKDVVKDEPDLVEIKDKTGRGMMEVKENRKRSIREMEKQSNIGSDVMMEDVSKETVGGERRTPFRESVI